MTLVMVMMMVVTTEAPRAGAMANRCSSRPMPMVMSTASGRDSHMGSPSPAERAMALIAPIITNSPWAKFTTSEAL